MTQEATPDRYSESEQLTRQFKRDEGNTWRLPGGGVYSTDPQKLLEQILSDEEELRIIVTEYSKKQTASRKATEALHEVAARRSRAESRVKVLKLILAEQMEIPK